MDEQTPNPNLNPNLYADRQNIFQRAYRFIRAVKNAGWRYATGDGSSCPVVYDPAWDERIYFVGEDGSLTYTVIINSDLTFMDCDGRPVELIHFGA